jgi:hypothetical protein
VRLAGAICGIKNFKDYLVLGDDIVICREVVALKYKELISDLGVEISIHKSVVPSIMIGVEFASKLINTEGNLSPLPIALLIRGRLIDKFSFLTTLVNRVLSEELQIGRDFRSLLKALFGENL